MQFNLNYEVIVLLIRVKYLLSWNNLPPRGKLIIGQVLVKYRSSVGQVSVKYRSGWSSISHISVRYRSCIGQVSVMYRSGIGQVSMV